MFKLIVSFLIVISAQVGYTQSAQTPKFFAQCMVDINTTEQAEELTLILRENPYVEVARVDWPTKRVFILTKNVTDFTEGNFSSWLGTYATAATCIQVGLHGVDQVNPYPFTNCNN